MKKLLEEKAAPGEGVRMIHDDPGAEVADVDTSEKEKSDKEALKDLKSRVKSVTDEINNAETPKPEATDGKGKKTSIDGLTKEPKRLKEKLILEEPSDMISEELDLDESLSKEEAIKALNEGLNIKILVGNKSVKFNSKNAKNLLSIADKIYLADK